MSNSPIIVPSENQIELSDGIPNDGESILIDDTTDADDVNIPLLSKTDVLTGSKSSHIDENTENEAVGLLVSSFPGEIVEHQTTNTETLMHLIKGNIGAGILAFPYALSKAGLVFGSVAFWIMGVITIYCMHQLLRCHRYYRTRTSKAKCDFGDIMRYTLEACRWRVARRYAKVGKFVIDGFIVLIQLGFCCVYFVFVPASIKQVVDYYTNHSPVIQVYQAGMLVSLIAFSMIRSLKILAPFSLIANIITVGGLCVIMEYIIRSHELLNELPLVTKPVEWPVFFSSAMYVFEGIALVLPVQQKMREPKDFGGWNGVLNTGMFLVTIIYFFVGFFGYIRYGSSARGSVSLNLPKDNKLYQITNIMYAVAIFLTYNLQFYVPFTLLWPRIRRRILYKCHVKTHIVFEYLFRIGLILITFAVAALIPNLGLVISLVGAVASTALSLIFPAICETITFWPNNLGRFKWQLILNILIITFGLYIFVAGTTLSISNIVACIREGTRCDD